MATINKKAMNVRLEPDLHDGLSLLCKNHGISMNRAINLCVKQTVLKGDFQDNTETTLNAVIAFLDKSLENRNRIRRYLSGWDISDKNC